MFKQEYVSVFGRYVPKHIVGRERLLINISEEIAIGMDKLGYSIKDLSKRTGLSQRVIRRMLRGENKYMTLNNMVLVFQSMGRTLEFSISEGN